MRFIQTTLALLLFVVAGLQVSDAQYPPGTIPGILREPILLTIAPNGTDTVVLEAMVTRPDRPGRNPLLIWSHGAPRDPADRVRTRPNRPSETAIFFAERGWTVVNLVRRGYGRSQGPYAESAGSCKNPDYLAVARASAQDVLAALKPLSQREDVDPSRVILAGISAGGFASLSAAGQKPPGLLAVLNFAGGRGSTAPDSVCREDLLIDAFAKFGSAVTVPSFWAYSANDHFFGSDLVRRMLAAFTMAGGKADFADLPAFGEDGHYLTTTEGMALWRDPLDQFMRRHNLPIETLATRRTVVLPPPPDLSQKGVAEFDRYLATARFEKAFVIGPRGSFAWRSNRETPEQAIADALATCGTGCQVYAVNNQLKN
jgi:dienelactone hydrolase